MSNVSRIYGSSRNSQPYLILNSVETEVSGNLSVLQNLDVCGSIILNNRDLSSTLDSLVVDLTLGQDVSFSNIDVSGFLNLKNELKINGGSGGAYKLLMYNGANVAPKWEYSSLTNLSDTTISNPVNNHALVYNGSKWTNQLLTNSLTNLSDTQIGSLTDEQVLTWDSNLNKWVNKSGEGGTLGGLTDVNVSSPSVGQFLMYKTGGWETSESNFNAIHIGKTSPHSYNAVIIRPSEPINVGTDVATTTYSSNIAIGHEAAAYRTMAYDESTATTTLRGQQGNNSIAIGYSAGRGSQGNDSIAIGHMAAYSLQGNDCVAIGNNAGIGTGTSGQGEASVVIGSYCGKNKMKSKSVGIGYYAGYELGEASIAIGYYAGYQIGDYAVCLGCQAEHNKTTAISRCSVTIGYDARCESYPNQQNQIAIGYGAICSQNNSIALGAAAQSPHENSIALGYNVVTSASNQFKIPTSIDTVGGSNAFGTSDDRLKHNETPITNGIDVIKKVNPLVYKKARKMYNDINNEPERDADGNIKYLSENDIGIKGDDWHYEAGFIAQEIHSIPELSEYVMPGDEKNPWYLSYQNINTYTLACAKELITKVETLESENAILKTKLNEVLKSLGKDVIK